jgi:hypothetical protein
VFGGKSSRTRLIWAITGAVLVLLSVGGFFAFRGTGPVPPAAVAFSDFLRDVQADRVRSVVVDREAVTFERRDRTRARTVAPPGYLAANPTLVVDLVARGVALDVAPV